MLLGVIQLLPLLLARDDGALRVGLTLFLVLLGGGVFGVALLTRSALDLTHTSPGSLDLPRRSIDRRSLLTAGIAVALVALFTAGTAIAALFINLDPDRGPSGTLVAGRTMGDGAFEAAIDPLPAFLVSDVTAGTVTTADDPSLVEVGKLVVDVAGNGRISFVVPTLDPGEYVLMIYCPPCAPTSAGRTMLPVADFTVTPSPPTTDTAPSTPRPTLVVVGVVGALLVVVSGLAVVRLMKPRRR